CVGVELGDRQRDQKLLKRPLVALGELAFLRAIVQFGGRNRGDADIADLLLAKFVEDFDGFAFDDIDADVGVEEVLHSNRPSRSSCWGCARESIKSSENKARLSNNDCQESVYGINTTAWPIFLIK